MKNVISDCIAELENISYRLSQIANDPKNYNHPISSFLEMNSWDNYRSAKSLQEACDRFGCEA